MLYPMVSMDFIMVDLEQPKDYVRAADGCVGDLTGRCLDFWNMCRLVNLPGFNEERCRELARRMLAARNEKGGLHTGLRAGIVPGQREAGGHLHGREVGERRPARRGLGKMELLLPEAGADGFLPLKFAGFRRWTYADEGALCQDARGCVSTYVKVRLPDGKTGKLCFYPLNCYTRGSSFGDIVTVLDA